MQHASIRTATSIVALPQLMRTFNARCYTVWSMLFIACDAVTQICSRCIDSQCAVRLNHRRRCVWSCAHARHCVVQRSQQCSNASVATSTLPTWHRMSRRLLIDRRIRNRHWQSTPPRRTIRSPHSMRESFCAITDLIDCIAGVSMFLLCLFSQDSIR